MARSLVTRLRDLCRAVLLLDGCEMREFDILGTSPSHDLATRKKRGEQLVKVANWIAAQDVLPIVAVIGHSAELRDLWRKSIPGYFEIYLRCSLETCAARDNKNIYRAAQQQNVIGVDLPFDEPDAADLVVDSDATTPAEVLEVVWQNLGKRPWFSPSLESSRSKSFSPSDVVSL